MQSRVLIATCVLLTIVTDGAHGHLLDRWLTRSQLPASWQHAAASRDDTFPTSAVDTVWSKAVDDTGNSVLYFVETKQELFVFGKGVPTPKKTPETTADTDAPSASTRAFTTSTSAPTKATSTPTTSSSTPTTSSSTPATSTSTPTTRLSIPRGYTYSPVTGSYYKLHFERYLSWDDANTACADEGAHLLVVNDAEEADIVTRIMMDAAGDHYYYPWIGLRNNRPGGVMDWRTVYGEPLSGVFHDWEAGRPLDNAEYTCAGFRTDIKQLRDYPCSDTGSFACEISQ